MRRQLKFLIPTLFILITSCSVAKRQREFSSLVAHGRYYAFVFNLEKAHYMDALTHDNKVEMDVHYKRMLTYYDSVCMMNAQIEQIRYKKYFDYAKKQMYKDNEHQKASSKDQIEQ